MAIFKGVFCYDIKEQMSCRATVDDIATTFSPFWSTK